MVILLVVVHCHHHHHSHHSLTAVRPDLLLCTTGRVHHSSPWSSVPYPSSIGFDRFCHWEMEEVDGLSW